MNLKMFRNKIAVFGIALASMFGAPLPMVNKSHEDEGDAGLNLVEEEGIICSEDIVQGEWQGWADLDERLYRYESMENLVAHDNEIDGKFWKTANFSTNERHHTIHGVRSDDAEFVTDGYFDLHDKHRFNQLCQDFNKNLRVETA